MVGRAELAPPALFCRYRFQTAQFLLPEKRFLTSPASRRSRHGRAWKKISAGIDMVAPHCVTLQYCGVEDGLYHEGVSSPHARQRPLRLGKSKFPEASDTANCGTHSV
jgi:hypothetical protein